MAAVSHALMILGFFEMPEEDRPPERIWKIPRLLNDHFEIVRNRREAKSKGMEPIDDDGSGGQMQNPVTAGLRR